MNIFGLLSYINKISLFVFFVTALVVGYQIYILKKEKKKSQTPSIPDFKEKTNLKGVINFTRLPDSLTKEDPINYSKLFFLIIILLTMMTIIIVVSLINRNSSKKTTLNKTSTVTPTQVISTISPTDFPVPTKQSEATVIIPTKIAPTEIILAQNPSPTPKPEVSPTEEVINQVEVLPETGSLSKGLLIVGVAISTIFFSFWF